MMLPSLYFWIFAGLSVLCGLGVLTARHPIAGAINLIGVMLSLAGIYGLLAAPFLAIVQILVYAGAIMMLVVFVIMVLNSAEDRRTPASGPLFVPALLLPALLVVAVVVALGGAGLERETLVEAGRLVPHGDPATTGTVHRIGAALFPVEEGATYYPILFEIVGLVLLAALTGAVLLAKRSLKTGADAEVPGDAECAPAEGGAAEGAR